MRATDRASAVARAMLPALAALASCSVLGPMTPEEVSLFEYGGYPASPDRTDCVRRADQALERTGPSGDMYDETRKRMRLDLIAQCMKQRERSGQAR